MVFLANAKRVCNPLTDYGKDKTRDEAGNPSGG